MPNQLDQLDVTKHAAMEPQPPSSIYMYQANLRTNLAEAEANQHYYETPSQQCSPEATRDHIDMLE